MFVNSVIFFCLICAILMMHICTVMLLCVKFQDSGIYQTAAECEEQSRLERLREDIESEHQSRCEDLEKKYAYKMEQLRQEFADKCDQVVAQLFNGLLSFWTVVVIYHNVWPWPQAAHPYCSAKVDSAFHTLWLGKMSVSFLAE